MIAFDIDSAPAERLIQHAANNWPRVFDKAISYAASAAKRSMASAGHYGNPRGLALNFPRRQAVTIALRPDSKNGGVLGESKRLRVERMGPYERMVAYVGRIGVTALRFQRGTGAGFSDARNRQWAYIQLVKAGTPEAERDRIRQIVRNAPASPPPREYVTPVAEAIGKEWTKDLAGSIRKICHGQMAHGRALA